MAGFVIDNPVLIIAGALVGASGAILTKLMADAMNRSVLNIMVGGFGGGDAAAGAVAGAGGSVREIGADDVAIQLAYAQHVIVVPGYGLAVAQAQHAVRELAELLESRGVDVKYAIHPVAGRMPGHMNVLLAEANVPYPQLKEMDEINPEFERADVALVIGANDVTEPGGAAARLAGLGHADPRRGPRQVHRGHQALDGPRLRRDRQRALHEPKTGMLFADAKDGLRRWSPRSRRSDRGAVAQLRPFFLRFGSTLGSAATDMTGAGRPNRLVVRPSAFAPPRAIGTPWTSSVSSWRMTSGASVPSDSATTTASSPGCEHEVRAAG